MSTYGHAPLDVEIDLTVTYAGQPISIESFTDLIRIELPSVRVLFALRTIERLPRRLVQLDALLRTADLTLDIAVDGVRVARIGAMARPQSARLPIHFDWSGIARAAVAAPLRLVS